MSKQPELHTTNLLMQPLSISFENAALQILRFSKIHEKMCIRDRYHAASEAGLFGSLMLVYLLIR